MKRSKTLSLLLMGSLAFGAAGCSEEPKTEESLNTFSSIGECVDSGLFDANECFDFAREAKTQTPRFTSLADCEATFGTGACEQSVQNAGNAGSTVTAGTQSSWMPMLAGFMAGRMLSGGNLVQGSQPLYQDKTTTAPSGTRVFRTGTGETVAADSKGTVTRAPESARQSIRHAGKPATARTGKASSGGFSGSRKFGSSGS